MALTLRPATADDEDRLLAWRNDPTTRRQARSTAVVAPGAHHSWLLAKLADPDTLLLVAEDDGRPVGTLRFDREGPGVAEISLTIAPECRGRGLARPAIALGVERAREVLRVAQVIARVKPENAASLRAFTGAGFSARGEADGLVELAHAL